MATRPGARFDPQSLIGLPTDEAVRQIEAARLTPAVIDADVAATMQWVSGLVRIWVRDGHVEAATADI
ncbi:MAG TPA: hypothetical protein VJX10_18500 [Pseudonocardiaceae bacterium]|nr:hypothetical protein [Pseudonocardiaceae bacterium]